MVLTGSRLRRLDQVSNFCNGHAMEENLVAAGDAYYIFIVLVHCACAFIDLHQQRLNLVT